MCKKFQLKSSGNVIKAERNHNSIIKKLELKSRVDEKNIHGITDFKFRIWCKFISRQGINFKSIKQSIKYTS